MHIDYNRIRDYGCHLIVKYLADVPKLRNLDLRK